MSNKSSIKLSSEGTEFLKNFRLNRIKVGSDTAFKSYADLMDVISKYFKSNKESYLDLVKMEIGKNV